MRIRDWSLTSVALIVLVGLIFYYPVIFRGHLPVPTDSLVGLYHPYRDYFAPAFPRGVPFKNFLITDPVRQQIPWRKIAIEQWKAGSIPWWNPFSFAGAPLAGNSQAGAFYPFNVVFLISDFAVSWTALIVSQTILSGIFMYAYLRKLRLHPAAVLLGSFAWSYSGFHIAWLEWGTIVHAALWLPVMLLSIDSVREGENGKRWYPVFVASASASLLAGHAQVAFYVLAVVCVYGLWRLRDGQKKHLLFFMYALVFCITITAIQWIPNLEAIRQSARVSAETLWKTDGWFLPWKHLIQFIAPDYFGNPSTLNYWGQWNYGEFIGYVGMLPFIFAVSRLIFPTADTIFWTVVTSVSVILMLPNPVSRLPYVLNIPLLASLQPTRLMVVTDFALSVLAAYGLNAWMSGKKTYVNKTLIAFGLVLAGLWVWILYHLAPSADATLADNLSVSRRNLVLPTLLWVAGVSVIGGARVFRRTKYVKQIVLAVIFVIILTDLLRFSWKFTPFTPREYFYPRTESLTFLMNQAKPFRILTLDDRILPPDTSGFYGIESAEGYDPLYLREYGDFIGVLGHGNPDTIHSDFQRIITIRTIDSPLLPLLNVRFILSLSDLQFPHLTKVFQEGETRIYEYDGYLPRAFFAYKTATPDESGSPYDLLFGDDVRNGSTAVVEHDMRVPSVPMKDYEYVRITSYTAGRITVDVSADVPRMLVVLNQYYPGWTATVDGVKSEIVRTNAIFQGVRIEQGLHTVELTYRRI